MTTPPPTPTTSTMPSGTSIPAGTPVATVGSTAADPTLGLLSHAIAVGIGAIAGFLSLKLSVTLSPDTQAEITTAAVAATVTVAHWVQAKISASKKGA